MRNGKDVASGKTVAWWPSAEALPVRPQPPVWKIGHWFPRREPTLFQRCLAVHIYHASKQTSIH